MFWENNIEVKLNNYNSEFDMANKWIEFALAILENYYYLHSYKIYQNRNQ